MKSKRTKQEQFVVELCHAFSKYGIRCQSSVEDSIRSSVLYDEMIESIQENWNEIVKLSEQLEYFYDV